MTILLDTEPQTLPPTGANIKVLLLALLLVFLDSAASMPISAWTFKASCICLSCVCRLS